MIWYDPDAVRAAELVFSPPPTAEPETVVVTVILTPTPLPPPTSTPLPTNTPTATPTLTPTVALTSTLMLTPTVTVTTTATISTTEEFPDSEVTPESDSGTATITPTETAQAVQSAVFTQQEMLDILLSQAQAYGVDLGDSQGVVLQSGTVTVFGSRMVFGREVRTEIILQPYVQNCELKVSILSATIAEEDIPEEYQSQLTSGIISAVNAELQEDYGATCVESVSISDGQMIITYS